jgi:hypothetical protein
MPPRNGIAVDGPARRCIDADSDSGGEHTIHGVALAADDVVRPDGERTRWSPGALAKMASTLENRPLMDKHTDTDPHHKVGDITEAWFDESAEAVRFRASLADDDLADKIESGLLELSPRVELPRDLDSLDRHDDGLSRLIERPDAKTMRHVAIVPRTERSGDHTRAGSGPGPSPTSGSPTASAAAVGSGRTVDASDAPDVSDLCESAATADMMFASAERGVPVARIFREKGIEPLNYGDEYDLRAALTEAEDRAFIGGEREGVAAGMSGDSGRSADARDDPDAYHVDTADTAATTDTLAESAATADLMFDAADSTDSVADLIRDRYDLEPDEYDDEHALRQDIAEAEAESGGEWR